MVATQQRALFQRAMALLATVLKLITTALPESRKMCGTGLSTNDAHTEVLFARK